MSFADRLMEDFNRQVQQTAADLLIEKAYMVTEKISNLQLIANEVENTIQAEIRSLFPNVRLPNDD